jgi:hypothetical protein
MDRPPTGYQLRVEHVFTQRDLLMPGAERKTQLASMTRWREPESVSQVSKRKG